MREETLQMLKKRLRLIRGNWDDISQSISLCYAVLR